MGKSHKVKRNNVSSTSSKPNEPFTTPDVKGNLFTGNIKGDCYETLVVLDYIAKEELPTIFQDVSDGLGEVIDDSYFDYSYSVMGYYPASEVKTLVANQDTTIPPIKVVIFRVDDNQNLKAVIPPKDDNGECMLFLSTLFDVARSRCVKGDVSIKDSWENLSAMLFKRTAYDSMISSLSDNLKEKMPKANRAERRKMARKKH